MISEVIETERNTQTLYSYIYKVMEKEIKAEKHLLNLIFTDIFIMQFLSNFIT